MSIRPYAEQDEVEDQGKVARRCSQDAADLGLVRRRGAVEILCVPRHPVNPLNRDRHRVEQHLFCHPEVRVEVNRGHGTLVAPEDLEALPGDLRTPRLARKKPTKRPRR